MENIGRVKIDYSSYSMDESSDFCRNSDDLLRIARDCSKVEYPKIIEEKASWDYLYYLSSMRENIVRWLPINKSHKVLEIGAGCGEITGALCEMAGSVISIEESKNKSLVNASRNSDCDNLTIYVGKYAEIEKNLSDDFDYVILVGMLEKAAILMDCDDPYVELIKSAIRQKKAGGRVVIATDNRLGLKYFAGNKESYSGNWYAGIEGYPGKESIKTFSKSALNKMLKGIGEMDVHYYYPYPDYRLMNTLYSDKRLPKIGELIDNDRNFDNDRLVLFDESLAFNKLIEDEIFDQYSNSYIIMLGPDVNTEYVRFSNDRDIKYAISTTIENNHGNRVVKKQALSKQGDSHILSMKDYELALCERYNGGKLDINKCNIEYVDERPVAVFEFVEGKTLGEIMNSLVEKDDNEGFMELFREYLSRIGYNESYKVTDKDIVFANIIVSGDKWTLIDYEWTVKRSIPTKEVAFRSIYCYLMEHKNANKLNLDLILDELELSQEASDDIRYDEGRFQKQITGNRLSMGELRNLFGYKKFDPYKLAGKSSDTESFYKFQVYRQSDGEFSESSSFFYDDAYPSENSAVVDIDLSADERMVRLDPLMDSCIVIVKECTYNGIKFPVEDKKSLIVNGKRVDGNSFVFAGNDPNMVFVLDKLPKQAMNKLHVEMEIMRISEEAAGKVSSNIKKFF
ncbi:MAG: hypothetical protein MJ123_00070 [Lachnospiraceae bacterium]|nr:hypothetical protein [Lachnospiraceae bacterium]